VCVGIKSPLRYLDPFHPTIVSTIVGVPSLDSTKVYKRPTLLTTRAFDWIGEAPWTHMSRESSWQHYESTSSYCEIDIRKALYCGPPWMVEDWIDNEVRERGLGTRGWHVHGIVHLSSIHPSIHSTSFKSKDVMNWPTYTLYMGGLTYQVIVCTKSHTLIWTFQNRRGTSSRYTRTRRKQVNMRFGFCGIYVNSSIMDEWNP
jgi:hypothetical protein